MPDLLIFITVGNHPRGFDRLMRAVDASAGEFPAGEEWIVQYGHSRIIPSSSRSFAFVPREEFDHLISRASVVVTHGGAGTVGKCLRAGKRPVVVPRRKAFGELVNDHQIELVKELEKQDRVIAVHDMEQLAAAVSKAFSRGSSGLSSCGGSRIGLLLKEYLDRLAREKAGRT